MDLEHWLRHAGNRLLIVFLFSFDYQNDRDSTSQAAGMQASSLLVNINVAMKAYADLSSQ